MDETTIINCKRFSNSKKASKYPSEFRKWHFRDWRERRAIKKAINYILDKAKVLDLPCGSGRLTKILLEKNFDVTASDLSENMLRLAKDYSESYSIPESNDYREARYSRDDVLAGTSFSDKEFDAVICHRLFHHIVDGNSRRKAIRELKRISPDLVILSFFNSFSLSAVLKKIKNKILKRNPQDRLPINKKIICEELEREGLVVEKAIYPLFLISPMCILVARSNKTQVELKQERKNCNV